MQLISKVVLITGGTGELGKVIGLSLLKNGAKIIINYSNDEEKRNCVEKLFSEYPSNYIFIKADITNQRDVHNLMNIAMSRYDKIDILINCAGISENSPFLFTDIDVLKKVIDVNLYGTLLCSRYFIKFGAKKRLKIINIGSSRSQDGIVYNSCYSSSKIALIGFTKSLAKELKKLDISLSLIYPPGIFSSINQSRKDENFEIEVFIKQILYMCSDSFFDKYGKIYQLEREKKIYISYE